MKKRIITIVLTCFLFIILSTTANSEIMVVERQEVKDDFLLSSNNAVIETCACQTFLDFIYVENIGNMPITYKISSDSRYVTPYPNSFVLKPGQKIRLLNYIRAPCIGNDFDFNIYVTTNTGLTKVMKQFVKVDRCQNLLLSPIINTSTIFPCQNAIYSFLINNTDGFTEKYYFDLDAFSEYAYFTENPATIKAMGSKIISFKIKPDCEFYGQYNLTLRAKSKYNNLIAYMPIQMNIVPAYDFSLSGPDNVETCLNEEKSFEYEILNLANFTNEYEVDFIGPRGVELSAKKFSLEPNQKGIFTLDMKPNVVGEFNSKLKVKSKLGDLTAEKNITIKVDDCYNFKIYFVEDKICKDDDEIHIILENNGKFDENFELSLLAPDFIKLEKEFVFVESGEQKEITIDISENAKYPSYYLEATARIPGKDFAEKTAINLDFISLKKCYEAEIRPTIKFVDYERNSLQIAVYNDGYKPDKYTITALKPNWIKFNDKQFFVNNNEKAEFSIASEPDGDVRGGVYKVVFNVYSENADYTYTENFYVVLSNNNIAGKIAAFMFNYWYVVLTICLLILALIVWLIYLVLRKRIPKKTQKKAKKKAKKKTEFKKENLRRILPIIIILLIIAAVAVFFCFDFNVQFGKFFNRTLPPLVNYTKEEPIQKFNCENYSGENICDSPLYIKINKNTRHVLELSDYFYDPDEDPLEYGSSTPNNITITIEGSKAYILPEKGWTGMKEVVFTASDPSDNIIVSDIFVIHVVEGEMTFWERIKAIFS